MLSRTDWPGIEQNPDRVKFWLSYACWYMNMTFSHIMEMNMELYFCLKSKKDCQGSKRIKTLIILDLRWKLSSIFIFIIFQYIYISMTTTVSLLFHVAGSRVIFICWGYCKASNFTKCHLRHCTIMKSSIRCLYNSG